jgi:predicted membrane chloride channel (bestrophin family)
MGFRTNSSYTRWYEGRRLWSVLASEVWTVAASLGGELAFALTTHISPA